MTKAFISYSTRDESRAKQLHQAMTSMGIPTFLAGISIEPGKKWTEEIFKNLKAADWIFFLASKSSCQSHAVQQELGASLIQNKVIIPILIDIKPEELPGWVDRHQAIDIKQGAELLHATIEKIAEKVRADKFWSGVIVGALLVGLFVLLKES